MSGKVKVPVRVARGQRGRKRLQAGPAPEAASAPACAPDRIPRVARVLALAHHWQALIRSGAVPDQAHLATVVGVTRARVTQVMDLLRLAPDIQEEILFAGDGAPGHRRLLGLASLPVWTEQRLAWNRARGAVVEDALAG